MPICVDIASLAKDTLYALVIDITNVARRCVQRFHPARPLGSRTSESEFAFLSPSSLRYSSYNILGISTPGPRPQAFLWLAELDRPTDRPDNRRECRFAQSASLLSSRLAPPSTGLSSLAESQARPTSAASMSQHGNPYAEINSEYHEEGT